MGLLSAVSAILTIIKNLNAQRRFIASVIKPVLSSAEKSNDGSLDATDFKKITHYYGLAVPAVLGEAFCCLHGKKNEPTGTHSGNGTGCDDRPLR